MTRFWISAASSISRTYFAPQTLRATSQPPLARYRTATRRRDKSPNFVPRHNSLGLSVKFTDNFEGNQITGYLETDFSGNDAPNVYQTVNSTTQRLRLYFADFKRGKWEFLGGQTWSWLTPNRNGLGPMPIDLALTYNEDQNLMVGVPYTRAAEFRAAYHPNEHWAMGVGIEDPNQYIGSYVALPMAFTSIGSQFDNNTNPGQPISCPTFSPRSPTTRDFSGRHFHAELTGLFTGAHASVMPVGSTAFTTHSVVGGGGEIAANYELVPHKLVCPRQRVLERRWRSLPGRNRAAISNPAKPRWHRRQSFHGARRSRLCGSRVESDRQRRRSPFTTPRIISDKTSFPTLPIL